MQYELRHEKYGEDESPAMYNTEDNEMGYLDMFGRELKKMTGKTVLISMTFKIRTERKSVSLGKYAMTREWMIEKQKAAF